VSGRRPSIHLDVGCPSYPAAPFLKAALREAADLPVAPYKAEGYAPLVTEIALQWSKQHSRRIDPLREVIVTCGASEALTLAFRSFLQPEQGVVLFDPCYFPYYHLAEIVHARVLSVPLHPPFRTETIWTIDWSALDSCLSDPCARLLVLNTPHNPTGKIFTSDELSQISALLANKPHIVVVCDFVYSHVVFTGQAQTIADWEGMWGRTVTVISGGKLFSVTGWLTGWAIGPCNLIAALSRVKAITTGQTGIPCQHALFRGLEIAESPYAGYRSYWTWVTAWYQARRDEVQDMISTTTVIKLQPIPPQGGFYMLAKVLSFPTDPLPPSKPLDKVVSKWLHHQHGVKTYPLSLFSSKKSSSAANCYLRFALCRTPEEYQEARARLGCPA
jgi:aspartate/methionine/tyrosine aminotransferase